MQTSLNFIPLDYDYFDWQGRNYVKITGRTEEGKRACVIDGFDPYFWAVFKEGTGNRKIKEIEEKIKKIKISSEFRETRVEKTEIHLKNFLGKPVQAIKIFVTNYKDSHPVADKIGFPEIIARREYDIDLITRYIIDKKVAPLSWNTVEGEILNNSSEFGNIDASLDVDICIKAHKIEKMEKSAGREFKPKILSFDLESSELEMGRGEILMISMVSDNLQKVLTWKKAENPPDYVECFKDEADMIEAFVNHVKKQNPDIITGYFSDGFDFPYLRARAQANNVKLDLGIDGKPPAFARGRVPSAKISGRIHVDLFRFIETVFSQYLQSETLGLHEVALELLGEGKKEFSKKKQPHKIKEHEWNDFFEYNLQDSVLAYKLSEKLWPDMLELSSIMQEPLFDVTRNSMSQLVEDYILHNLCRFNEIAEKRPLHDEISKRRERERYTGAFVLQPTPGLYENLAMFDFTSYWPSIIVTYNLSKTTFLESAKQEKDAKEVDLGEEQKVYFSTKPGFFPQMLAEIIEKRKKYKAEYKKSPSNMTKARSNAYKLLANASYGYQGFFGARYYCPEASAATTAISRDFIKNIIEKTNRADFKVLYADTDGFCFLVGKKSKKEVLEFLEKLNKNLPGVMELELEDFYKRGIWVTKRTGERASQSDKLEDKGKQAESRGGAKKKYALIAENNKMKIRGFETVRRDWCPLARKLQSKVLELILKEGNEKSALELLKKTAKELKERKIPREQVLVHTQLKKLLSEYKSITPHVAAAQKMKEAGHPLDIGMTLTYFIAETREKKALVREKVKLDNEKGEYNIKYYLEHQLLPAVENIFQVFGINVKETTSGKKQMKLF